MPGQPWCWSTANHCRTRGARHQSWPPSRPGDILAHPGSSPRKRRSSPPNGAWPWITTRKGHSLTNGHVAALARRFGAKLVINNDAHAPEDLVGQERRKKVALGAGLTHEEYCSPRPIPGTRLPLIGPAVSARCGGWDGGEEASGGQGLRPLEPGREAQIAWLALRAV